MNLKVELPAEVVEALGPEPEREVLEGVLLLLVSEGKMSVARAGEILGLESRISAIRWYTRHGLPYPDLSEEDLTDDLKYASS
jgi:predicted HTH domain antitoxin